MAEDRSAAQGRGPNYKMSPVHVPSAASTEADRYRIEADCAMRDYDALEVDAGIMGEALAKIAEGRRNNTFDPWARQVARDALAEVSERVKDTLADLSYDRETISGG